MSRAPTLGSVEWNRKQWGDPETWERNGDIWAFHAESCGQAYGRWKQAVVETFLDPYLGPDVDVLEIAAGHGRWSEHMAGRSRSLTLVDLNASCIDVCRDRFGCHPEVSLIANDGRSLPVADASVDVIWSFGGFVHMDAGSVDAYLAEFRRVLRPGGRYVIHHSGWPERSLRLVPITRRLGKPGRVLQHRFAQGTWGPGGDRVPMSPKRFASMATNHGLCVDEQVRTWGADHQFGLAFNDVISLGSLRQVQSPTDPSKSATNDRAMRGRVINITQLSESDEQAWRDLAKRAIEPNPFYEADCLIPAATHQTFGQEIQLVVAEDGDRFYACMPIRHVSRWHKLPYPIVTSQVRRMIYQGTPLVDAERGTEAVSAMLGSLVEARRGGRSRVFALQEITDGPVASFFRSAASELGLPLIVFESFQRGLLRRQEPPAYQRAHSAQNFQRLRRKQRSLGRELGGEVSVVDRGNESGAIEEYIALEASGYKAEVGVAMATVEGESKYFREMCERFAAAGRLHLLALTDGRRTPAMVVWVRSGESLFQIKCSYDERYARYSPGLMLHTEAMRYFQVNTDAQVLDSCTWSDNEMINRLYSDRRPITSFFIILGHSLLDQIVMMAFVVLRPAHRKLYELTRRRDSQRGKRAPGDVVRRSRVPKRQSSSLLSLVRNVVCPTDRQQEGVTSTP